ncbi:unnamed protein product [Dovyalis caffra]|uniref:Major facilitator superfamily (MFS) profile domain-containing protein n=1 Tax=Dovyalis caffra TaxID=77055 RepID=A0AAV1S375_9ROSI|nr:unnamed protein product [Dovyalis caffra]
MPVNYVNSYQPLASDRISIPTTSSGGSRRMQDGERMEYTLDDALASAGFGKYQFLVLAYAGLGWFTEAMEIMILSFVGPVVKSQWNLSSTQESMLSTVVFAGMLVGAYSWGLFSDNCGRRQIVMPRLNWRWLLAFSALPSIGLLFVYSFVPESPRYLCMKGKITDAHNILEKIARLNQSKLPPGMLVSDSRIELEEESSPSKFTPLLSSTRKVVLDFKSGFSSIVVLFSSKLIRTTFLLWLLFFGNAFAYYGIILLTSELSSEQGKCGSTVLKLGNLQDDRLYINVFITSLAELPGILLSAIIVDRFGRKLSMAFMLVVTCIFLLPLVSHRSGILTTALLFGARMCAIGSFTVAAIYAPEVYPTAVRATGAGVSNAVGRIGGMVCPLVAVGLVTGCHLKEAIILFEPTKHPQPESSCVLTSTACDSEENLQQETQQNDCAKLPFHLRFCEDKPVMEPAETTVRVSTGFIDDQAINLEFEYDT